MEKIIKLSDNKIMIFFELPVVAYKGYNLMSYPVKNSLESQVIGYQKTKIRFRTDKNPLKMLQPKKKFYEILRKKYETNSNLKMEDESKEISIDGITYRINVPREISLNISPTQYGSFIDKHVVENRRNSINSIFKDDTIKIT